MNTNNDVKVFILNEIKQSILNIIENNGYDNKLFNITLFAKALEQKDFIISEYEIGRIYTLAEIYFKLVNKASCYGEFVELIVAYDTERYV